MKHYARSRAWCEWDGFDAWQGRAEQALADPEAAPLSPFHLLSLPGISAAQQRQCAERWMAPRLAVSAARRSLMGIEFAALDVERELDRSASGGAAAMARDGAPPWPPRRPIRLGYLSGDFHQHATALLMIDMLAAHDRGRFELHAFSHGADDGQGMRQRLQAHFDAFHDIAALDDATAARAIHAADIDILVDLKGYTAGTRTALLSYRPAPVQVGYLGYPGTAGGDFCDYLISDRFITPEASAADYSEALACMPHSYQPHGRAAQVGATPRREAEGLPADGFVFCCFNQAYKFTPEVFGIWCRLLEQAPGSVLWLLGDALAEGNLRREALQRGIAPHRLVFAPGQPQAQHLARLPLADLVLDTAPYNAHTTASDALWAGVPLVTCAGDTFASRVAGSLLHAVGLPELVTSSLDDYADLAADLAADPARLRALRDRLERHRQRAPLFDVRAYTLALEALFEAMWQRHGAGLRPQALGAGDRGVAAA